MKNNIEKLTACLNEVEDAVKKLNIDADTTKLAELEKEMASPDLWNNQERAERVTKEASVLKSYINSWNTLKEDLSTTLELIELEPDNNDYENTIEELISRTSTMLVAVKLNGEYDKSPAILQLSAGVGGTDAADWTEMLMRMYLRFAEKSDLSAEILEESPSEEAGIKSATLRISGPFAYGKLKSEKGVHRLVRLSPFNSDNLRQTSFALVDVIPEIAQLE
jgi:peptide chain release factor 2